MIDVKKAKERVPAAMPHNTWPFGILSILSNIGTSLIKNELNIQAGIESKNPYENLPLLISLSSIYDTFLFIFNNHI